MEDAGPDAVDDGVDEDSAETLEDDDDEAVAVAVTTLDRDAKLEAEGEEETVALGLWELDCDKEGAALTEPLAVLDVVAPDPEAVADALAL